MSGEVTKKMSKLLDGLEKSLNRISEPIQPLLPSIARFLLVVTWLEDSLRIFTQWQEQVHYIEIYGGYSNTSSSAILALLVIMMMIGSILAILKIKTPYAVGILFSVIIIQGWIYGLYQEAHYIFRNLSITGGLVLLLADYYNSTKNKNIFAGIPTLSAVDKSTYLQVIYNLNVVVGWAYIINISLHICNIFWRMEFCTTLFWDICLYWNDHGSRWV